MNTYKQTSREPLKQCLEGPGRVKIWVRTGTVTRSRKSLITSELNCSIKSCPGWRPDSMHRMPTGTLPVIIILIVPIQLVLGKTGTTVPHFV